MSLDEFSEKSGYAEELFQVKPGRSAYCGICFGILRDCQQCSNFHNFCKYCLTQSLLRLSKCPQCKTNLTIATMQHNRALNDVIGEFKVRCYSNLHENIAVYSSQRAKKKAKLDSCSWSGELNELAAHMAACDYAKTVCPFEGCGADFPRHKMLSHKTTCIMRPSTCVYCNKRFPRKEINIHISSCSLMPFKKKSIVISGAYGVNAYAINGIYDVRDEMINESTVYLKRGENICIHYYSLSKEWLISNLRVRGTGHAYARFGCDPLVSMEECNIDISRVANRGRWENQTTIGIFCVGVSK